MLTFYENVKVQNGSAFIAGRLGERFGYKRMIAVGAFGMTTFTVISAFCYTSLVGYYLAQAVGVGLSIGMAMPLCMSIPSQWFDKRRGLATGIATSGSGIGGAISTTITRLLITRLGPRKTLLIMAAIQTVIIVIGWSLLKVRDVPENRLPKHWLPGGIWRKVSWYSLAGAVFVATFGYLVRSWAHPEEPLQPLTDRAATILLCDSIHAGEGSILDWHDLPRRLAIDFDDAFW